MFDLAVGPDLIRVRKIHETEFGDAHRHTLSQLRYESGQLVFPDRRWCSLYLGAGEEKAVFCIGDESQRVFALEVIDERHYLNGRFVGGKYFSSQRVPGLNNQKADPDSDFGLIFTGLVKAREFVHGFEWSRFQFDARRRTRLDFVLTSFLQTFLVGQFRQFQAHYNDVHDRNVLFEIKMFNEPGIPVLLRSWAGRLQLRRIGVQAIDVR